MGVIVRINLHYQFTQEHDVHPSSGAAIEQYVG